MKADSQHSLLN